MLVVLNYFIVIFALLAVAFSIFYIIHDRRNLYFRANFDSLTKLYRRDVFMDLFSKEVVRAVRYKNESAVIFCDIDNFKSINDKFGHDEGDRVLRKVGEVFVHCSRVYDLVCRYGGEEFVLYLPHVSLEQAKLVCHRIKEKTADETKMFKGGKVTYSFGISMVSKDGSSAEDLISKADKAMYFAKKTKDTIAVFEEDAEMNSA